MGHSVCVFLSTVLSLFTQLISVFKLFNYFGKLPFYHAYISYTALDLKEAQERHQAWPAKGNDWVYSGNPLAYIPPTATSPSMTVLRYLEMKGILRVGSSSRFSCLSIDSDNAVFCYLDIRIYFWNTHNWLHCVRSYKAGLMGDI